MDDHERLGALGKRVRLRREARGLSIDQAAELGTMSPVTWSRVEQGKKVRGLTYGAVDDVLSWPEGACKEFLASETEPVPVVRRDPNVRGDDESQIDWMRRQFALFMQDETRRTELEQIFERWGGKDTG